MCTITIIHLYVVLHDGLKSHVLNPNRTNDLVVLFNNFYKKSTLAFFL